ncbi:MAG TPA: DinB family protein [Fibrobacteria bacterium]|nr:DinB family protein [Fibrobacteria bacterium]
MSHVFSRPILQEFHRQIGLFHEFLSQVDESLLWKASQGWTNSVGVLVRHLVGNVHHFVGTEVLSNGYVREREAEFRAPPVGKAVLLRGLEASRTLIEEADGAVVDSAWEAPRTTPDGRSYATLELLMASMASHASYHLGQASVLVRFLAKSS